MVKLAVKPGMDPSLSKLLIRKSSSPPFMLGTTTPVAAAKQERTMEVLSPTPPVE
nr:hypothetical protein [Enterococcus faecalis]